MSVFEDEEDYELDIDADCIHVAQYLDSICLDAAPGTGVRQSMRPLVRFLEARGFDRDAVKSIAHESRPGLVGLRHLRARRTIDEVARVGTLTLLRLGNWLAWAISERNEGEGFPIQQIHGSVIFDRDSSRMVTVLTGAPLEKLVAEHLRGQADFDEYCMAFVKSGDWRWPTGERIRKSPAGSSDAVSVHEMRRATESAGALLRVVFGKAALNREREFLDRIFPMLAGRMGVIAFDLETVVTNNPDSELAAELAQAVGDKIALEWDRVPGSMIAYRETRYVVEPDIDDQELRAVINSIKRELKVYTTPIPVQTVAQLASRLHRESQREGRRHAEALKLVESQNGHDVPAELAAAQARIVALESELERERSVSDARLRARDRMRGRLENARNALQALRETSPMVDEPTSIAEAVSQQQRELEPAVALPAQWRKWDVLAAHLREHYGEKVVLHRKAADGLAQASANLDEDVLAEIIDVLGRDYVGMVSGDVTARRRFLTRVRKFKYGLAITETGYGEVGSVYDVTFEGERIDGRNIVKIRQRGRDFSGRQACVYFAKLHDGRVLITWLPRHLPTRDS